MIKYCIIPQFYSLEDGWCPSISDDVPYTLLAEPGSDIHWALYCIGISSEVKLEDWVIFVPDDLEKLLASGVRFPPAIALARDKVAKIFKNANPSESEFIETYTKCLREFLDSQSRNNYIFAPAIKGEICCILEGEYYWVIKYYEKSKAVLRVTDDYFVFKDSEDYFDLNDSQKKLLQENKFNF